MDVGDTMLHPIDPIQTSDPRPQHPFETQPLVRVTPSKDLFESSLSQDTNLNMS